jgi:Ni,Fe-hydrogenase maturation factor
VPNVAQTGSFEMTRHAELLIIVDAVLTGREPGEVTVFPCSREGGFNKGISMHNRHYFKISFARIKIPNRSRAIAARL